MRAAASTYPLVLCRSRVSAYRVLSYFADSKKSAQRRLIGMTLDGPFPVRFLTRLASPAFARLVAASSIVIPSRFAMRSTNSNSLAVSAADSGPF